MLVGYNDERIPLKGYTEIREIAEDFKQIMDKANGQNQSKSRICFKCVHELKTLLLR